MFSSLLDIPDDVLVERVLPALGLKEIIALSHVNKRLRFFTKDDSLWASMAQRDFFFDSSTLARPDVSSGFYQQVYLGLSRPRAFVWGNGSHYRLGGVESVTQTLAPYSREPTPIDLTDKFPQIEHLSDGESLRLQQENVFDAYCNDMMAYLSGAEPPTVKKRSLPRIVEMQASGWGFVARCHRGGLYVWGTLNDSARRADNWESPAYAVRFPTNVPLPCPIQAMGVGRTHVVLLDTDNLIWDITAWGKAYHHTAAVLTGPHGTGTSGTPHHVVQVSAGWRHSACLTRTGDIFYWVPYGTPYLMALTPDDQLVRMGETEATIGKETGSVRCGKVNGSIVQELPAIPVRPSVSKSHDEMWMTWPLGGDRKATTAGERVVKIAGGVDFLIALKGNGEVWYHSLEQASLAEWTYLSMFSSPHVTHISAQFQNVTSYTTSSTPHTPNKLYMGRIPESAYPGWEKVLKLDPLPELEDHNIIKVAHGDWHHTALTSSGEMYAWGCNDVGQLGIGRLTTSIKEPQRVIFPTESPFVFNIAAAGHHCGALVLGGPASKGANTLPTAEPALERHNDEDHEMDGAEDGHRGAERDAGSTDGPGRGRGLTFRVGYAGRGSRIGRVAQAARGGWGRGGGPTSLRDLGFRPRDDNVGGGGDADMQ